MRVYNINNFKQGWLVGNFEPTLFKSELVEIAHHHYKKDYKSTPHTHKIGTEYNYILRGHLVVSGRELKTGEVFVYEPNEISDVKFLEDTDLIIIKTPSIPDDKYLV